MTPPKAGSKPGTTPEQGAPEKLAAKVAEVAQNPDAFSPSFDVWRVPPNGDGRHMMYAGEIPRQSFVDGVLPWIASTLGAGNFRIDIKDAVRLHAGSLLINNGVDRRPPELRAQPAATQATAAAAPAAQSGTDMSAVLVAMVQAQSAVTTALLTSALSPKQQPDDLDRLVKLRELLTPPASAAAPASAPVEAMKLGLELGRKLAEKSGAGEFLEEHAKEIFENIGAGIGLLKDVVNKRPTTATVVDAKAQTVKPSEPAAVEAPAQQAATTEPSTSEPVDAVLEQPQPENTGHG